MMTAQRARTDFLALTISAGGGKEYSDDEGGLAGMARYAYRVTVASDATGAKVSFTFHDSAHRHDQGIDQLDAPALLEAFWSFVSDAQAGSMPFREFADEFGYDSDSIRTRRVWEACKRSAVKFGRLFHDDRTPEWCLEQLAAAGVE